MHCLAMTGDDVPEADLAVTSADRDASGSIDPAMKRMWTIPLTV